MCGGGQIMPRVARQARSALASVIRISVRRLGQQLRTFAASHAQLQGIDDRPGLAFNHGLQAGHWRGLWDKVAA
jgi:hypothetical protein